MFMYKETRGEGLLDVYKYLVIYTVLTNSETFRGDKMQHRHISLRR